MDDCTAPLKNHGLGHEIEHDLVPGFIMRIEGVATCETDSRRPEPHAKYQITDPDGSKDWLCAYDVHAAPRQHQERQHMPIQIEHIARVTHEANRAYQLATGDPAPSPHWDDAPAWQRDSAIEGITAALAGRTPEQSHEGWLEHKRATGWTYGPVKDESARTHPCMVAYADLPPEQQMKDDLFVAIVRTLTGQPAVGFQIDYTVPSVMTGGILSPPLTPQEPPANA